MIHAKITLSSMFIDKPKIIDINLDENQIAVEKIDESTGVKKKITVGQLFDLYKKGNVYYNDGSDPDGQITPQTFEQWFYFKHIHEKGYTQRLLSIEYTKQK